LNIFVYGDKLFKSEIKKLFLKTDIEADIAYLEKVDTLKEKLDNKTSDDFFIIDENYVYDSSSFTYNILSKIKKIKNIFQNKIDKKYLKTSDNLCFETLDSIIEYINKICKINNETTDDTNTKEEDNKIEQNTDINNDVEENNTLKTADEITEIEEIREDMLDEFKAVSFNEWYLYICKKWT